MVPFCQPEAKNRSKILCSLPMTLIIEIALGIIRLRPSGFQRPDRHEGAGHINAASASAWRKASQAPRVGFTVR
jgi:hypothetical protein